MWQADRIVETLTSDPRHPHGRDGRGLPPDQADSGRRPGTYVGQTARRRHRRTLKAGVMFAPTVPIPRRYCDAILRMGNFRGLMTRASAVPSTAATPTGVRRGWKAVRSFHLSGGLDDMVDSIQAFVVDASTADWFGEVVEHRPGSPRQVAQVAMLTVATDHGGRQEHSHLSTTTTKTCSYKSNDDGNLDRIMASWGYLSMYKIPHVSINTRLNLHMSRVQYRSTHV